MKGRIWLQLVTLLLISFAQPVSAGFSSEDEVAKWFTYYYRMPEPGRVPEAIEYMSRSGLLNKESAVPPIFGFLSTVFRDNPGKVPTWIKRLGSLPESHQAVVVLGVWYANLPDSKRQAHAILDKNPTLQKSLGFLYQGDPMRIEQIPLEQGPWVLDALWGEFMASGSKAPVLRIMTALPWADVKGDVARLAIGSAAQWSLSSNAIQHPRVLEICEAEVANQPAEIAGKLRETIAKAKAERTATQRPAHAATGFWRDEQGEPVQESDWMKSRNDFGGSLIATTDEDWQAKWNTPPDHRPHFTGAGTVPYGKKVTFLIFFTNPKTNSAGQANVRCDLRLTAPTGKISLEQKDVTCFSGKLEGDPYNIYLAAPVLAFSGDPGDPPGIWVMDVRLRDAVRNVELSLRRTIELK